MEFNSINDTTTLTSNFTDEEHNNSSTNAPTHVFQILMQFKQHRIQEPEPKEKPPIQPQQFDPETFSKLIRTRKICEPVIHKIHFTF